ncbi:MAG: magnesium transporter [Fibrella sp.]|nr:magnesium transporter [Armatimonadota bacterium]
MPPQNTDDLNINDSRNDELVQRLKTALSLPSGDGGTAALTSVLEHIHPADIAAATEFLTRSEALALFNWLDNARAAEVIDELDPQLVRFLIDNIPPGRIADLLDRLPMDDAAEVVAEAAPERQEPLIKELEACAAEDAREVRELLSYKPRTAGRLMVDKFVRLKATDTVEEAFASVRSAGRQVETLTDLYVVEPATGKPGEERLVGVISLRGLVYAEAIAVIGAVMATDLVTVTVDTDQEEVARLISKYDFLAMPVIDRDGNLAGIITVDDVIDILVEENTEDALKQGGVEPGVLNTPYFSTPIWQVVRSRVTWLVLLFVAETATGSVLRHFDDELAKVTALAFFIPLLIGTGGNTGAQTVSTIIRGIALKEIRFRDTGRVLGRELLSGLLLGLVLGSIAFGRALMWDRSASGLQLASVVGITILVVIIWANTIGSLIPLAAQKLKIDPALVSAPLITTLVDATGLVFYLLIAKAILAQLH